MRRTHLLPLLLLLAACANTGDPFKDAALDHNQARNGFNAAVAGVTIAIRAKEIDKDDARQFIKPLVLQGQEELDAILASLKAGEQPTVNAVSALLGITTKILTEQARLASKE